MSEDKRIFIRHANLMAAYCNNDSPSLD